MDHSRSRLSALLAADWPILVLFALDFAVAVWAQTEMPAIVPTHWGMSGTPDALGPAAMNVWFPLGLAGCIYLLFLGFSAWAERSETFPVKGPILKQFRWSLALFFLVFHGAILTESIGAGAVVVPTIRVLIPLLFLSIASTFPTLPQNPFIGIRLPWTLYDAKNWRWTHDRAAKIWYAGGAILLLAALLPLPLGMWVFLGVLLCMVLIPTLDSYLFARRNRPS